jgi:hypothetical protein
MKWSDEAISGKALWAVKDEQRENDRGEAVSDESKKPYTWDASPEYVTSLENKLSDRMQELQATCAAQREALEAIYAETMTVGSGQGASNIRRLVDHALSSTVAREYEDRVWNEALDFAALVADDENLETVARKIRAKKRGGK